MGDEFFLTDADHLETDASTARAGLWDGLNDFTRDAGENVALLSVALDDEVPGADMALRNVATVTTEEARGLSSFVEKNDRLGFVLEGCRKNFDEVFAEGRVVAGLSLGLHIDDFELRVISTLWLWMRVVGCSMPQGERDTWTEKGEITL